MGKTQIFFCLKYAREVSLAKMKISFALIAGALSQSTNSSVEQGITELPLASDSLLSASNSSSISDLEVCEKGTWGEKCFYNCNCGGNACDKETGVCEGDVGVCPPHYEGTGLYILVVKIKNQGQDVTSPSATISAPEREASALRPIAVYVSATTRRALISSLM